jgi:hypothetical protein
MQMIKSMCQSELLALFPIDVSLSLSLQATAFLVMPVN